MTYSIEQLRLDLDDIEKLTGQWVERVDVPESTYDDLLRESYEYGPWKRFLDPTTFESWKEHLRVSMQVVTFYGVVVRPANVTDPIFRFKPTKP